MGRERAIDQVDEEEEVGGEDLNSEAGREGEHTQHQVQHHEYVFPVLEGEPEVDQERVFQLPQDLTLSHHILHCMLVDYLNFVHVLHGIHLLGVLLLHYADLEKAVRREGSPREGRLG